ncbi:hypothetical protein M433DRAFT_174693 [Acidomyces richmondensis BFW]|nr:hypothetical protein M433DRAFT_174693 [Acidomyces richmondensis BFW]
MSCGPQLLENQSASDATRTSSEPSIMSIPMPCPKSNFHRMQPDAYAELHWEICYFNPKSWRARKRWFHTIAVTAGSFTVTMASSTPAIAFKIFADTFKVSPVLPELPLALFVAGLSMSALIGLPLSDILGRKICYILSFLLFAILTLAAGFVHNRYSIVVCTGLAGVFGSVTLCAGYAILLDMWRHSEQGVPFACYNTIFWLGPAVGMIFGGYVTIERGLYWVEYIILFAAALCILPISGM